MTDAIDSNSSNLQSTQPSNRSSLQYNNDELEVQENYVTRLNRNVGYRKVVYVG